MKHSNGPSDAEDVSTRLYRAALGSDPGDRYLRRFQALDAGTAHKLGWHWGACASALVWLAWRGLFGMAALWSCAALLGSVLALGLARLVYGADGAQLAGLLLALALLASLAWGLGAERLYHRLCSRRVLRAVEAHDSIAAACAQLQRRHPGRLSRGTASLLPGAAVLALLAALVPPLWPRPTPALAATGPVPEPQPAAPEPAAAPSVPLDIVTPPAPTPTEPAAEAPAPAASAPSAEEPPAAPAAPLVAKAPPAMATRYAVQIGVFAQPGNARAALAQLQAAGLAASVDQANAQGHQRVRVGPFATRAQAQRAGERVRALGLPAVVVRLQATAR
ncbi:SPOR domain-containing protein [Pseudorhodoferax sp.]|uniref:SPOR domain-containing protein n=1 Tax=Pseudorhodoferax sp. TaxID=1993553 RepID=UPI002DD6AB1B|nr:SPOR domain-containing protein [Pseudorhodoferax sp.]